mmetsp:Transcript_56271/g.154647  ORF Transcript_56271/g.154647 Transcript_56271/m.154647 type:complete len:127 (-) Transcript_56271:30-410(-)
MLVSGAAGGPIGFGMFTVAEQVVFTVLVIFGSLMWSELIGTFAAIFSNLNPERTIFRNRMDKLNWFMAKKGIERKGAARILYQLAADAGRGVLLGAAALPLARAAGAALHGADAARARSGAFPAWR